MQTDDGTWPIQDVARRAGVTSRTLRHYDDIGLLRPTRLGTNGLRRYDAEALVRLQRILLLRDLGLGLTETADALASEDDEVRALRRHADWLRAEQARLERRIAAVERTITRMEQGENPMRDDMFEGFDHTVHEAEVTERWGADSWKTGNDWWASQSAEERAAFAEVAKGLSTDWASAADADLDPTGPEAESLADRHLAWLGSIPGTPRHDGRPDPDYVLGLADLYVADPRFAANYGGEDGARFVRAAIRSRMGV